MSIDEYHPKDKPSYGERLSPLLARYNVPQFKCRRIGVHRSSLTAVHKLLNRKVKVHALAFDYAVRGGCTITVDEDVNLGDYIDPRPFVCITPSKKRLFVNDGNGFHEVTVHDLGRELSPLQRDLLIAYLEVNVEQIKNLDDIAYEQARQELHQVVFE